jgi:hypothetical protein
MDSLAPGRGTTAWRSTLDATCPPDRVALGRSYLAIGGVIERTVDDGALRGQVQGSGTAPYEVEVHCRPLAEGELADVEPLLRERLGSTDAVLELLCPSPADLRARCTCSDWSPFCKHAAALFLAFLEPHPRRREEVLALRGLGPDTDIGAAALAASWSPAPPRPRRAPALVFGKVAPPPAPPRRARRRKVEDDLLLPLEGEVDKGSPPPSRPVAPPRPRSRPRPEQLDLWGGETADSPTAKQAPSEEQRAPIPTPPQGQQPGLTPPAATPPLEAPSPAEPPPPEVEETPAAPYARFWRGGEIPPPRPVEEETPSVLALLGPPPWTDSLAGLEVLWSEARQWAEDTLAKPVRKESRKAALRPG